VSETRVLVRRDTYVDSVLLMSAARVMQRSDGVEFASALMGTEANCEDLRSRGVRTGELEDAGANDLVLAVVAATGEEAEAALEVGAAKLAGRTGGAEGGDAASPTPRDEGQAGADALPRTIEEAVDALPGANTALISVPGEYAALEAHQALTAGLHVLLFSDNVSVHDEVALKRRAAGLGRLVMGPGAGTGMLGGIGLGLANAVRRGPVGVVAAAGTGAQEVMALLDRWGSGVSAVIGVGGRDLSADVGGTMTELAIRSLEADPDTDAILLVTKPPAPEVAERLLAGIEQRPAVAALIGLRDEIRVPDGIELARTLEEGVVRTLASLGHEPPDPGRGLAELARRATRAEGRGAAIRGLFSGGTLCYESMVVISERVGPVYSNVPLDPAWSLPAPPGAHVCLDLGEEEYTKGRPHPMIDPEPRAERIVQEIEDDDVGVLLVDLVLGYGSHPDPASVLVPACRAAAEAHVPVVAHVLGTDGDPQGYDGQSRQLEEAGCLLAPTGARAALLATALAVGDPELAEAAP
jgi:FdrA protein